MKITDNLATISQEKFNSRMQDLYIQLREYNKKSNSIDEEAILISYVSTLNQQGD